MERTPLVVANWKMNTDLTTALNLAEEAQDATEAVNPAIDVVVCPPYPWIVPVSRALAGSRVSVGAQDVAAEEDGAYTGDVSAAMVAPWVRTVIVGHSERRALRGETDELVGRKLRAVLKHGLRPLLCLGETLAEREAGAAESVISRQFTTALDGLAPSELDDLSVAYEPVWAIGTGRAADQDDAEQMARHIRTLVASTVDPDHADRIRVLYGGSVNAANVARLTSGPDVDGALVGSASLAPGGFAGIIAAIATAN
ncbi:MAG TPA: triose-phosphate isomerase [Thermomicrobiales bacterium]|nr:triose-phosphate isomerase [Thermomicrobiales bacterium]